MTTFFPFGRKYIRNIKMIPSLSVCLKVIALDNTTPQTYLLRNEQVSKGCDIVKTFVYNSIPLTSFEFSSTSRDFL